MPVLEALFFIQINLTKEADGTLVEKVVPQPECPCTELLLHSTILLQTIFFNSWDSGLVSGVSIWDQLLQSHFSCFFTSSKITIKATYNYSGILQGFLYHLHCKPQNSETAGLQLSFLITNWKNIQHEHSASSTEKHNCKVNNLPDWSNLTKCSCDRSELEIPYPVEFVIAWAQCNKHCTWKLYCFSEGEFAFMRMS